MYYKNDRPVRTDDSNESSVWAQIHVVPCQQACMKVKELFSATKENSTIISNHYVNTPGFHFLITVYIVESCQTATNRRYN